MLRWLIYLGLMVLLMAIITTPTEKEWKEYAFSTVDTTSCKPAIRYNSYKIAFFPLFSLTTVRECTGIPEIKKPIQQINPDPYKQRKYLGLFGTFWKL